MKTLRVSAPEHARQSVREPALNMNKEGRLLIKWLPNEERTPMS